MASATDLVENPNISGLDDKAMESVIIDESMTMDQSSSTQNTNDDMDRASRRKRCSRTINLGLDGNYWHGLNSEIKTEVQETVEKPKRSRRTVDRFSIDLLNSSSSTNFNEVDIDQISHNSLSTSNSKKDRRVIYNAQTYLAVRNEENGFYLCRLINKLYEDTKKTKIEWLEEIKTNTYEVSFVDWLDPLSIIRAVKIIKTKNPRKLKKNEDIYLYSINTEDLLKIERKLKEAIEGVAFVSDSDVESSMTRTSDTETSSTSSKDNVGRIIKEQSKLLVKKETDLGDTDLFNTEDNSNQLETPKSPATSANTNTLPSPPTAGPTQSHLEKKLANIKNRVIKQVEKHEKYSGATVIVPVEKPKQRIKRFVLDSSDSDSDNYNTGANKKSKITSTAPSTSSIKPILSTLADRVHAIKKPSDKVLGNPTDSSTLVQKQSHTQLPSSKPKLAVSQSPAKPKTPVDKGIENGFSDLFSTIAPVKQTVQATLKSTAPVTSSKSLTPSKTEKVTSTTKTVKAPATSVTRTPSNLSSAEGEFFNVDFVKIQR
jgi:hypothetical protein